MKNSRLAQIVLIALVAGTSACSTTRPPGSKLDSIRPRLVHNLRGPDGRPVKNRGLFFAIFFSDGRGRGGARSDGTGRVDCRMSLGLGVQEIMCVVPGVGYLPLQRFVVRSGTKVVTQTIRLRSGGRIFGTVREEGTLRPIGGAILQPFRVYPKTDRKQPWNFMLIGPLHHVLVAGYPMTAVSRDGDGTFTLQNLPPGEYHIGSYDSSPWAFIRRCVVRREGESINGFDVQVPQFPGSREITGRILLGPNRTPLVNAEVMLKVFVAEDEKDRMPRPRVPGVPRRVVTRNTGEFCLYPLKPEKYWITASVPGRGESERVTIDVVDDSKAGVEFVLHPK